MVALRRIAFYIFVVLYLVICPLTILYAFGYTVQPGASRRIVRTGLISITSTPPGADVYLGRRRFTQRTPATIRGLLPGSYDVRLALRGHRTWEATVSVEEERATVLDHALLLPTPLRTRVDLAQAFTQILPLTGHRVMVLARGARLQDLVAYDWRAERAWPIGMPSEGLGAARLVTTESVRGSEWLLLHGQSAAGDHWLWCEPSRGEEVVEDLSALFLQRPGAAVWDARSARYVFAMANGRADRIDSISKQVSPRWAEQIEGLDVLGRWVYVLHQDGRLVRTDRDGKAVELIARLTLPRDPVFGAAQPWSVHAFAPDAVFVLGPRGELFDGASGAVLAEKGIAGLDWDPRRRRALVWERGRAGVLDWAPQDPSGDTAAELSIRWVSQGATNIEQAAWIDDGFYALIRDDNRIVLLEAGLGGPPRLHDIATIARNTNAAYAEDAGRIYYLDPATGFLSSVEVASRRDRLPLVLPELMEPAAKDAE
jgi:hypothetical protein